MAIGLNGAQLTPEQEEEQRRLAALQAPGSTNAQASSALTNPFSAVNVTPVAQVGQVEDNRQGLNFNEKYAPLSLGIDQKVVDQQYQQHNALAGLDAQYQRQMEDSGQVAQQARSMLAARMGGRGISNSGIAAGQVGKQEQAQAQNQADLGNWLAGSKSQVQAGFVNNVNDLYRQRDTMFANQTSEEAAAAAETARIQAEQVAQQQAQEAQRQQLAQQAAQYQATVDAQNRTLAAITANGYGGEGGGRGPRNDGPPVTNPQVSAPQQQFSPDWSQGAAPWEDLAAYSKQFYTSGRDNQGRNILNPGSMESILSSLGGDAAFSGMMQNSMGKYYGGAQNMTDVARWILNPRMNENASREYNGVW